MFFNNEYFNKPTSLCVDFTKSSITFMEFPISSGVNKEKNSIELTFGLHQGVSLFVDEWEEIIANTKTILIKGGGRFDGVIVPTLIDDYLVSYY